NEHGVPMGLARMDGVDFAHLIEDIDGYLCEIGAAQIRDGLHVLGQAPAGGQLVDMLCALTRLPNIGVPGLPGEVARCYGLELPALLEDKGKRLDKPLEIMGRTLVTRADAVEAVDAVCRALYGELDRHEFQATAVESVVAACLGSGASAGVAGTGV